MSSLDSKLVMVGVAGALFGASAAGLAFLVANHEEEEEEEEDTDDEFDSSRRKKASADDSDRVHVPGVVSDESPTTDVLRINDGLFTPSSTFRPSPSLGLASSASLSPIDAMPALIGSVFQNDDLPSSSPSGIDAARVFVDAAGVDEEEGGSAQRQHTIRFADDDDDESHHQPPSSIRAHDYATSIAASPNAKEEEDETPRSKEEEQILLNLLYSIAEDQARREGVVHRGIICNACQRSPVIGVRYKCANCLDYDICESCEPKDRHDPAHVFVKIRVPLPPLSSPRSILFSPLYVGRRNKRGPSNLSSASLTGYHHGYQPLSWHQLKRLVKETQFDHYELESLHEQYFRLCAFPDRASSASSTNLTSSSPGISRENFNDCLGTLAIGNNLVVRRLFKFYDQNDDEFIDFPEMAMGLSVLIKGSLQDKLPHVFRGYDLDGRGSLSKDNLRQMFKAYFSLTVELVKDVVRTCEEDMFHSHYDDGAGKPVSALFTAPIPTELGYPPPFDATSPSNTTGNDSGFPRLDSSLSRSNSGIPTSLSALYLSPTSPHVGVGTSDHAHAAATPITQPPTPHCRPVGSGDRSERFSTSAEPDPNTPKAPTSKTDRDGSDCGTSAGFPPMGAEKSGGAKDMIIESERVKTGSQITGFVELGKGDIYANPAQTDAQKLTIAEATTPTASGRRCAPMWPVIEAMSQDAVAELVDSFFANAGVLQGQRMSYDQFFTLSQSDRSLLAWFEALGTVF